MSDNTVVAIAIAKRLQKVATIVNAAPGTEVDKATLVSALEDPLVCMLKPGTQDWHFYNTETKTWEGEC